MTIKTCTNFKSRLFQQIASSFDLRLTYMGFTFLTNIILARFLGAEEFGVYTYTVSWAYLLGVFGTVGLDNLLVREIAVYQSKRTWGLLRGMLHWANWISFLVAAALGLVAVTIAFASGMDRDPPLFTAFCLAMISLPFLALRNLRRGAMRGLQHVALGLLPEMLVAPVAIVALLIGSYILLGESLSAVWCVGIYTFVSAITLLVSMQLLRPFLPIPTRLIAPQYRMKQWLVGAIPFMFLEGINVINARVDILMLGSLQGIADAGVYVPVNRGAQLINFVLMAISSALAPKIASLYAEGRLDKLQQTVVKIARMALIPTLVFTAALIAIAPWYLNVFGAEFIRGQNSFTILCVGQLLFTVTGLGGLLLNMTGNEKYTAITGGVSALLNALLNYILISRYGMVGAAIATSLSLIIMNLGNIILVRCKLNICSTGFGL